MTTFDREGQVPEGTDEVRVLLSVDSTFMY